MSTKREDRQQTIDEIRLRRALFAVEIGPDQAVSPLVNAALLAGDIPAMRTWRPPQRLRRFGRARRSSYRPVLTPLSMAFRDLVRLHRRAVRWLVDSLEGRN